MTRMTGAGNQNLILAVTNVTSATVLCLTGAKIHRVLLHDLCHFCLTSQSLLSAKRSTGGTQTVHPGCLEVDRIPKVSAGKFLHRNVRGFLLKIQSLVVRLLQLLQVHQVLQVLQVRVLLCTGRTLRSHNFLGNFLLQRCGRSRNLWLKNRKCHLQLQRCAQLLKFPAPNACRRKLKNMKRWATVPIS